MSRSTKLILLGGPMVSKWFVRKAYTVSFDYSANEVWDIMSRHNEPYVFITDLLAAGKIAGFIRNTDMMPSLHNQAWMNRRVSELPFHTNVTSIQRGADMLDFFKGVRRRSGAHPGSGWYPGRLFASRGYSLLSPDQSIGGLDALPLKFHSHGYHYCRCAWKN